MPEAPSHPMPEVSVCVCTFRRPALLGELLDALAGQRVAPPFEVVVVDNDRAASAGSALAAARARHPSLPIRDALVPEQNIARARNRAVSLARGRCVAFLDDDERPVPRWLGTLHRALGRFGADGVFGPVVAALPPGVPPWIERGGFFDRPRHPSGAPVPARELRTGNALLRRELLGLSPVEPLASLAAGGGAGARDRRPRRDHHALAVRHADSAPVRELDAAPFDPRWGLSGGEDTALLVELAGRGARFVWCDDAVVHERVPEERARLGYLLRRSFASGCGHARFRLDREGPRALPSLLVRGAGALWLSSLLAPLALPLGRHRAAASVRLGAAGLGKLAGLAGYHDQPYRDPADRERTG